MGVNNGSAALFRIKRWAKNRAKSLDLNALEVMSGKFMPVGKLLRTLLSAAKVAV
jgi:hypothetical protein